MTAVSPPITVTAALAGIHTSLTALQGNDAGRRLVAGPTDEILRSRPQLPHRHHIIQIPHRSNSPRPVFFKLSLPWVIFGKLPASNAKPRTFNCRAGCAIIPASTRPCAARTDGMEGQNDAMDGSYRTATYQAFDGRERANGWAVAA